MPPKKQGVGKKRRATPAPRKAMPARQRTLPKKMMARPSRLQKDSLRSLPATVGVTMSRSTFGFAGPAQQLSDHDPGNSLRVAGRDLFYAPITGGAGTQGFDDVYYTAIAPTEMAARLSNIETIFQYYAIRQLRIMYAPATGSTSTVQIALGYVSNYNVTSNITAPTQTQVLEFEAAALFPAWQPASIDVLHRGTKVWYTSSTAPAALPYSEFFQGALACVLLNGVDETVYGQLWLDYVVDFYAPCPILTAPTRSLSVKIGASQWRLRGSRSKLIEAVHPLMEDEKKDPIPTSRVKGPRPVPVSDDEEWTPSPPSVVPPLPSPGVPTAVKVPSRK
jgi:hypothetical protein